MFLFLRGELVKKLGSCWGVGVHYITLHYTTLQYRGDCS